MTTSTLPRQFLAILEGPASNSRAVRDFVGSVPLTAITLVSRAIESVIPAPYLSGGQLVNNCYKRPKQPMAALFVLAAAWRCRERRVHRDDLFKRKTVQVIGLPPRAVPDKPLPQRLGADDCPDNIAVYVDIAVRQLPADARHVASMREWMPSVRA